MLLYCMSCTVELTQLKLKVIRLGNLGSLGLFLGTGIYVHMSDNGEIAPPANFFNLFEFHWTWKNFTMYVH